ncbi:MAG: AI-2E family transporter [Bacteroidota bacterium]|nr:AI-2E family transporter [Bacteroidota bacterium]MDP4237271.1 AI-2E family transporter [Bacteroidota bacterium]
MAKTQDNIILTAEQDDPESVAEALKRSSRFDGIAIALGGAAFIALVGFIITGNWPFIAGAALFLLLFPYRDYRAARTIMFSAGILMGLWLFITLASLLFPFIIGLLIAYLFNPLVSRIDIRWKVARGWSSLAIVFILCGIIFLLGLFLIPRIVVQLQALLTTITDYFQQSTLTLDETGIRNFFLSIGLSQKYVDQYVTGQLIPQLKSLYAELPRITIAILSAIPGYAARLLDLIIIPIAAVYFLKDWNTMIESIQSLIPQRHRLPFIATFRNIDKVLYGYIRGQSIVAITIGTLAAIVFMIIGIPYSALLGIVIAFLDLIPFIGLIMSIVVVEAVILLTMPITFSTIASGVLVIAGLHTFENYYLGPKIVGKGVGIPPILIIISIFIFGYFMGFLGMIIAVPLTGVILLFVREYRQALADHPLL